MTSTHGSAGGWSVGLSRARYCFGGIPIIVAYLHFANLLFLARVESQHSATKTPWKLKLTFRGVRGSCPTPRARNMDYGGNTSCVEILLPSGDLLLFDAGTGIHDVTAGLANKIHLFFSHFHWDHIQGFPYFAPLYQPERTLRLYSSQYTAPLRESLSGQMKLPYFPIDFNSLPSRHEFSELGLEGFREANVTVRPFELHHPQGACGYRIESEGTVIVYATDHELGNTDIDAGVVDAAQGADLLIFDAQYTPSEMERCRGRGHSTWQDAVEAARRARVRQLVLFHHDPDRDDGEISSIVMAAREQFPNTEAAREGWTITF